MHGERCERKGRGEERREPQPSSPHLGPTLIAQHPLRVEGEGVAVGDASEEEGAEGGLAKVPVEGSVERVWRG